MSICRSVEMCGKRILLRSDEDDFGALFFLEDEVDLDVFRLFVFPVLGEDRLLVWGFLANLSSTFSNKISYLL